MTLLPKDSGEFIIKHAKFVHVNKNGIDILSELIYNNLKTKRIDVNNFCQHHLHPKMDDPFVVEWLFVVNTLNFCFWTPGIRKSRKYRVDGYTGHHALYAAINRAVKGNIDMLNPTYYSKITAEELTYIMRSDSGESLPLIKERVENLQEVGKILLAKYNGSFINVVKSCKNNAEILLKTIVSEFSCYQDEAVFHGQRVSFYKRAQILIGDLWTCFQGKGLGYFHDLDTVTMLADFRIPQLLVHFRCLKYTDSLTHCLKKKKLMKNGAEEEVEIRGASIYIVEEVKRRVREIIAENDELGLNKDSINSILIDHFLWDYRRQHARELYYIPYHKVVCIYY